MKIRLKELANIVVWISAFVLIFNDWLLGIAIGASLSVAMMKDDECCKKKNKDE